MKNWFLFIALITSIVVNAQKLTEEELELNYENVNLYGTLLSSPTNDSIVVLIIPGSGPTDRDGNSQLLKGKNNSLKYLAENILGLKPILKM